MPPESRPLIDLGALSEPVTKLIESISSAVGALYEPMRIRKKAKAEAEAEVEAAIIRIKGALELQEIAARASERINILELRRQNNIQSIVGKAVRQLPDSVSEEAVDEDWVVQFFNYCQDVSNEEIQLIWARLLAGEVAQPGSYSPRTLHLVRLLRPSDAILFRRACSYIWSVEGSLLHFRSRSIDDLMRRKNLRYNDFLHLQTLGLATVDTDLHWGIEPGETHGADYQGALYSLVNPDAAREKHLPAFMFAEVAKELAPLCDTEPDEEYRVAVVESWTEAGVQVEVLESKGSTGAT